MRSATLDWRRLLALCRKETLQILRDPSSILIAAVLPVVLLFIFGFGVNLDANRIRVGIAVGDSGAEARGFVQALQGSPFFDLRADSSRERLRKRIDSGELRGMVVVGADFSAKVRQGTGAASIQVLTDGSEPNTANFLGNYVQGVWQTWLDHALLVQRQHREPQLPRAWLDLRDHDDRRRAADIAGDRARVGTRDDGGAAGHAGDARRDPAVEDPPVLRPGHVRAGALRWRRDAPAEVEAMDMGWPFTVQDLDRLTIGATAASRLESRQGRRGEAPRPTQRVRGIVRARPPP